MENVSEYGREHLYPILEQTIIPEFKESYHTKKKELKVQPSAPQFNQVNKIDLFLLEKKKLDEKLIHYKKIKNRWTNADSGIKIGCISITGLLTISTSIFSGITLLGLAPVTGIIITSIFGGFNAVYLFLSEGISIGLTSKKKKIYREVCEQLELGINKLYLFQMKALEDNILSTEEIIECQKIIQEINEKINKIKYGSELNKEVKNKVQQEKIEKMDVVKAITLEYEKKIKALKIN